MKTTSEILKEMLTENTGTNFLDSGGADDRHWQKNQDVDWDNSPKVFMTARYGHIEFEHNIYHWLLERVKYNDELTKENETHELDGGKKWTNSYNENSLLSQVISYVEWKDKDGLHVTLCIHGGADVRGGYTDPKVFDIDEPLGYGAHGIIKCHACDSTWETTDAGTWKGPNKNLEDHEFEEFESRGLVDPEDIKNMIALANKPTLFTCGDDMFCPICGGQLMGE